MMRDKLWLIHAVGTCSLMHFLVDGICACCLYLVVAPSTIADVVGVFIIYNVLAFLTQPMTGWITDHIAHKHWVLLTSMLLLTIAVGVAPLSAHPATAFLLAVLLGMGNSLFHVWGGQLTTVSTQNDIRALGVFVSTGAFGLAIGMVFASWWLLFTMLIAYCLLAVVSLKSPYSTLTPDDDMERSYYTLSSILPWLKKERSAYDYHLSNLEAKRSRVIPWYSLYNRHFVVFLFVLVIFFVAFRSSLSTVFTNGMEKTTDFILMAGLVAMLGKAAGGFIAKSAGVTKAFILMLAVAVGILVSPLSASAYALLVGLFAINCTMPVTLYWGNRLMPRNEGLVFGLLAAALIPAYLIGVGAHPPLTSLLWPLLVTIVIELLVLLSLAEHHTEVLWASVAMNVITNPLLNIIILNMTFSSFEAQMFTIVAGEFVVMAVEALFFYFFIRDKLVSTLLSLACNGCSFMAGLLYELYLLWC